MTNDEINIAIAEYRNWRNIKEIDYQPFGTDPYIWYYRTFIYSCVDNNFSIGRRLLGCDICYFNFCWTCS